MTHIVVIVTIDHVHKNQICVRQHTNPLPAAATCKIIDKFDDEKQLMEFLQSDRGLAALNTLTTSGKGTKVPILVTASIGFLALFMGFGAMLITWKVEDDLIFPAVFLPSIAIGLFAASAFSYFLGRKWGLFDQKYLEAPNSEKQGSVEQA